MTPKKISSDWPLYRRTKTKPNGETQETVWGPSAVKAMQWIVVLILGVAWAVSTKAGIAPGPLETLLRWIVPK
jgi:hypothetical protein